MLKLADGTVNGQPTDHNVHFLVAVKQQIIEDEDRASFAVADLVEQSYLTILRTA